MSKVYLVASLTPKQGMSSEMETVLRNMCEPSRSEPGCVFYSLLKKIIKVLKLLLIFTIY